MSLSAASQYLLFLLMVTALVKPAGAYMARVFEGSRTPLDIVLHPLERIIYWIGRVDPKKEMSWLQYALAFVVFSGVGTLALYGILRLQNHLPGGPAPASLTTPMTPDLAMNTAISFSTTSTWQAYASCCANNGQSMAGLTAASPFYNLMTAGIMMIGRFGLGITALALAGRFAAQGRRGEHAGSLPSDTPLFAVVALSTALLLVLLNFLPALALGPVVEQFKIHAGG